MKTNYVKAAKALKDLGISVVPLRLDGSKLPKIKWGDFQDRVMTDKEIIFHFSECGGIAAITGNISRLYCLDFDLKYQFETQDFWKAFMEKVPKNIRKKMLVNETKNKGKHIWMRTDFEDKSRHYTRRACTIPELMKKYEQAILDNTDPLAVSEHILKSPWEVVIESRSRGSYAVIRHPDYTRIYGNRLQEFSIDEVTMLNEIAYSLDYCFQHKEIFNGTTVDFSTVRKFNEEASAGMVLSLLESTGMYKYVETKRDGTIIVLRIGSSNKSTGKIFADNAVLHLHSPNAPLFDTSQKNSISPFEVYMVCKNLTYEQAINELNKQ